MLLAQAFQACLGYGQDINIYVCMCYIRIFPFVRFSLEICFRDICFINIFQKRGFSIIRVQSVRPQVRTVRYNEESIAAR